MIIDCISDLHGEYPLLGGGDLLIIAGDLVGRSDVTAYTYFCNWLNAQNYRKKVVISGNHDTWLEENPRFFDGQTGIDYLCDSSTEFEGLKIYGSPWTHRFQGINPHCCAYAIRSNKLESNMESIPYDDIDILVTHTPPYMILDEVWRSQFDGSDFPENTGSVSLRNRLLSPCSKVKLHVFGHIHEHGGRFFNTGLMTFINASLMNEHYEFVNEPVRIEL